MTNSEHALPRNLFEVDNARYLSTSEVVNTFVATDSLWRLLSAKNHIVLGARGSGKTALFRMLAHSHLSKYRDKRASKIISSRAFIGFYLPAKADWIGGLKNKSWLVDDRKEEVFSWRLNLASCISLAGAFQSCLDVYYREDAERIRREYRLVRELADIWGCEGQEIQSVTDLREALERLDYSKQLQLVAERADPAAERPLIGASFHLELFQPVKRAIQIAKKTLEMPEGSTWMLCLDEAEALESFHHRIINSYLRTHSDDLVFKISTTPYGHKTLDTNVGAGLSVGNDFEYVYIDKDLQERDEPAKTHSRREAEIFRKRAAQSGPEFRTLKLTPLLGPSELLDQVPLTTDAISLLADRINRFGDQALKARASKLLLDIPKFRNEIGRKVRGALLLREALSEIQGQQEIDLYSGVRMVVRCSDGNPRRLIRLFNKLLREGDWKKSERGRRPVVNQISSRRQTEILRDFSLSALARVQGEEGVGRDLHDLLQRIGVFMRDSLHAGELSTDTISSIRVSKDSSERTWALVKAAVGLGFLFPNVHPKTPDEMPDGEGVFRFAYVFAPHFYLLPRRGKSRSIESMLSGPKAGAAARLEQATLFGEGLL